MRGFIKSYGTGGMPVRVCVYDDGLLVVRGGKGATAGLLFGAIGAALARRSALKRVQENMEAIRDQTSAAAAAQAIDNELLLPTEQITGVTIGKALFGAKKLTIGAGGSSTTLRFNKREQTVHEAQQLLGGLLGDRLQVTVSD